jgi:UDP-N-acetyl-D-galactosamine dehydrogenase
MSWDQLPVADAMIAAVAHRQFLSAPVKQLAGKIAKNGCFIDVKSQFPQQELHGAGLKVWRL